MNYEEMSDIEINAAVTCIVFDCKGWEYSENGGDCSFYHCGIDGDGYYEQPVINYCNNPSDAWPIILPTGMSIELAHKDLGGIGTCTIYNSMGTDWQCDFEDNDKALRAAMICFLKMQDTK